MSASNFEYLQAQYPPFGEIPKADPLKLLIWNFQYRSKIAYELGFIGGFPNFYEQTYGLKHVGGTIFLNGIGADRRSILPQELGNLPLDNPGDHFRATQRYATQNGFIGGFPTFVETTVDTVDASGIQHKNTVFETILIKSEFAEWRDVPRSELGNVKLDDIGARFRAVHDYATSHGFVGGFPTLFHQKEQVVDVYGKGSERIVCGTILLKQEMAEWRDVILHVDPH